MSDSWTCPVCGIEWPEDLLGCEECGYDRDEDDD